MCMDGCQLRFPLYVPVTVEHAGVFVMESLSGYLTGTSSEAVYDNQTSGAAGEPPWRTPVLEVRSYICHNFIVGLFEFD